MSIEIYLLRYKQFTLDKVRQKKIVFDRREEVCKSFKSFLVKNVCIFILKNMAFICSLLPACTERRCNVFI